MNLQAVFEKNHAIIGAASCNSNALLSGKLGLVLYYFTLYQAFEEEAHADRCIELLQEVMDTDEDDPASLRGVSFAGGTTGLGYVLALLNKHGLTDINMEEDFSELDKGLYKSAMYFILNEDRNDFLHGAFGILHYFTTRMEEPQIRTYLSELSAALCNKAISDEQGAWFRSFFSDPAEKERIDLGLAHGNAGMLLILLSVLKAAPGEQLANLVRNGVNFILAQQSNVSKEESVFPFFINATNKTDRFFSPRMAWCYGDTGILLLLYKAAYQLGDQTWKSAADQLAVKVLARKTRENTLVEDSHFCHGSAGLVQLYNSLYLQTKNSMFQDAARFWAMQTVTFLENETISGYYKGKETDLLNGLPGINLALLPFLAQNELAWSQTLLL